MPNVLLILRNVFSNWITLLISIAISFFLTPFIITSLGKSYYGIWMLINSLIGYMSILDFGIRPAVNRFVAKYIALNDRRGIDQVVMSSCIALWSSALVLLVLTGILTLFFEKIFNIENVDPSIAKSSVAIVGIGFSLGLPMQIFGGVLSAFERYDLQNVSRLIVTILRTLFIIYFLSEGYTLIALAAVTAVTAILQYFIDWLMVYQVYPRFTLSIHNFNPKLVKEIVIYGIYSCFINISILVTYYTDITVIGIFLSASSVALYAIPASLIDYSRTLVGQISRVFTPTMTKAFFGGGLEEVQRLYLSTTPHIAAFSFALVSGLAILGGDFIRLWVGSDFSAGYAILLVLLIPQAFGLSQQLSSQVMFGMGKNNMIAYLEICSALSNLLLSLLLVHYMGLIGVALGTAIPLFITHSILLPYIVCRHINLSLFLYISRCYLRTIGLSFLLLMLLYGLRTLFIPDKWLTFIFIVSVSLCIYGIGYWFFIIENETKAKVLRRIKHWEHALANRTGSF